MQHNIQSIQILTPLQEGLLFHSLAKTDDQAYFEQYCFTLPGKIDEVCFEKSLVFIFQRHDALRTKFIADKGVRPVQVILESMTPELSVLPLEKDEPAKQQAYLDTFLEQDRLRSFELQSGPLFRVAILQLGDVSKLVVSFHHIILDGWSYAIIMHELISHYRAEKNGQQFQPGKPVSFTGITGWLATQKQEEITAYWLKHLDIEPDFTVASLTPVFMQPSVSMQQVSLQTVLTKEVSNALKQAAVNLRVSVNSILYGIWGILLSRYSRRQKVVSGVTVSGREIDIPDAERVVGMCINTMPFAFQVEDTLLLDQYFKDISGRLISSFPYQYCSVVEIQHAAGIEGALFDHILAVEDYPFDEVKNQRDDKVFETTVFDRTNYPLSVHISVGEGILWRLSYNPDRYPDALMVQVLKHIELLATQVAAAVSHGLRLSDISIWGDVHTNKLINSFNDTKGDYPVEETLLSIYYAQLNRQSPAILEDENHRFTVKEIERYSNAVQAALAGAGIEKGDVVAICCERSVWLMVAIMGVFKRGATYLPIDMRLPEERIFYMMQDAGAKVVLGYGKLSFSTGADNIYIDIESAIQQPHVSGIDVVALEPADAAYIIYTSGSTGNPKGVVVEHGAVVNRIYWMQKEYPLSQTDCILQKTTSSFDVSVWELFHWLFSGCNTFFLAAGKESAPDEMIRTIKERQITVIHFVPSMLTLFMDMLLQEGNTSDCASLQYVFSSGEALSFGAVLQFNDYLYRQHNTLLINLYGPTEATVDCTGFVCSPLAETYKYIPIGKPLLNDRAYIFDEQYRLLPPWIAGELWVAGVGVARGYIGKESLTREKFMADPFVKGERMYRTGDLVMWSDTGNLIYLGRIDQQIKFNGQRIEPGDIEAKILLLKGVREAVVLLHKKAAGISMLYALYTGDEIPLLSIREQLAKWLPAYMIPSGFKCVEHIPRLGSGKINRKEVLLLLKDEVPVTAGLQEDAVQLELRQIWQKLIGKQVDPAQDFFANGGHSLTAIRMLSAIRRNFDVQVSLPDILTHNTLKDLSAFIKEQQPASATIVTASPAPDALALLPAQESIYVLESLPDIGTTYHVPGLIRLEEKPDEQLLLQAIKGLMNRHTVLCTRFVQIDGNVQQQILPADIVFDAFMIVGGLTYLEPDSDDPLAVFRQQRQKIAIDQAPLCRFYLLQQNSVFFLLMDIHHLITDEYSNTVFLRELIQLYHQEELPQPSLQFHDVVKWYEQTYLPGEQYANDKAWWATWLEALPASLQLPAPAITGDSLFEGNTLQDVFPAGVAGKIRSLSADLGVTDFAVILSVFQLVLARLTKQASFTCGIPVSNRSIAGMEEVTGFMVNTLPIRADLLPAVPFREYMRETGRRLTALMQHAWYPLSHILMDKKLAGSGNTQPLFNILFNYVVLPQDDDERDFPDKQLETDAKFDLSIEVTAQHETFFISVIYATGKVDAAFPQLLYDTFCELLEGDIKKLDTFIAVKLPAVETPVPLIVTRDTTADTIILQQLSLLFKETLGLEVVHPEDDFFFSGGHSLLAIKLINRIRERLKVKLNLYDVFNNPRLIDLASLITSLERAADQDIPMAGERDFYAVSPLQRRLWLLQTNEPKDISYNMTTAFRVMIALNKPLLEECLDYLVQRHDQLRASIVLHDDGPVVKLSGTLLSAAYLHYVDGVESVEEFKSLAGDFCNQPFILNQGPLFRVMIMQNSPQDFYIVFNLHHIITDGWSISILLSELILLYNAKLKGDHYSLPPLSLRYVDFAQWMSGRNQQDSSAYWLSRIGPQIRQAAFPHVKTEDNLLGATSNFILPDDLSRLVIQTALERKCTTFQLMMFAFALLQSRLSGNDHFIIGTSVSGRTSSAMEPVVGFFVNMMPVVVNIDKQVTLREALQHFAAGMAADMAHAAIPFDELSALFRKDRAIQLGNYINTRFVYNDFSSLDIHAGDIAVEEIEVKMEGSKFDLSFTVQPLGEGLSLNVEYRTSMYTQTVIHTYANQWQMMLKRVCELDDVKVESLFLTGWDESAVNLKSRSHELLKHLKGVS